MPRASAAATALLSVFLSINGRRFLAALTRHYAVSWGSSPLGSSANHVALKPCGGASQSANAARSIHKVRAPPIPAACHIEYGTPSGPGAVRLDRWVCACMVTESGIANFEKPHFLNHCLASARRSALSSRAA